ncbi:hypothetical protein ACG0Z6_04450 [Roseateles sp. BYS180W]|uniref:Uncharacterized protein n=1 Tax=Roseateles rivi TaxID=3299028 RepID=A0ABW7FT42_9BURK
MSMPVTENLTQLSGRVLSWEPHPLREGWVLLQLQLESCQPVPGKADMLGASLRVGRPAQLVLRQDLLAAHPDPQPVPGLQAFEAWRLRCRAKFTPEGAQVEAHPEPEHFQLARP